MVRKYALTTIMAALALGLMVVLPVLAQDPAPAGGPSTITVTGIGDANGAPDVANLTLGVEMVDADIKLAFAGANDQIGTVIQALIEAGVAENDIRTSGLNIYQEQQPMT